MTMLKYVLCFAVLAVALRNARAHISKESELAVLEHLRGSMDECAKEFSLNTDELKDKGKSGDLGGIDKCFFACVLKHRGMINEEGKFDVDKGLESLREYIKNDDDFKVMENIAKDCVSVNDEEVSDGNKGCERAYLVLTCIKKHKEEEK